MVGIEEELPPEIVHPRQDLEFSLSLKLLTKEHEKSERKKEEGHE